MAWIIKSTNELSDQEIKQIHLTQILQKTIENSSLAIETVPCTDKWAELDSESDIIWFKNNIYN